MFDVFDALRCVNVLGSVLALAWLLRIRQATGHGWNRKTADHWWALSGWVFLGIVGSVEQVVTDVPGGFRTLLHWFVVAWTLRAIHNRDEELYVRGKD